ncbi:hypothetical protein SRB17_50160 [Streptomyces sp. RB17]|nr:hypothetical protein [Streptomyces sp. RB17]
MVFQDGWWYLGPAGEVRGAIVLDNLIHRGDIPVTIGAFVDPGVFPHAENPKNRDNEYDAFDDQYVTFLLTEIIPQVAERNVQRNVAAQYRSSSGQSSSHGRSGPAQSTTAACCSWFAVSCPLSTRAIVRQAVKWCSNSG